jgi:hypothetical protein
LPQPEHSTVTHDGFVAVTAASSSESFSLSKLCAAASASFGLTVAGSTATPFALVFALLAC